MIKRHGRYYVYIVKCRDGSYYTGYTNDLKKRVKRHNTGNGAKYLRGKRPVKLVYARQFRYYKNALKEEKRIKTLPRIKKQELAGKYRLSKTYTQKRRKK